MTQAATESPVEAMRKALRETEDGQLRTYVLVDGALLRDLPSSSQRRWAALKGQSLLTGVSDEVGAVGPILFSVAEARQETDFAPMMCDLKSGRVVGSLLFSDQEPAELARVLASLVHIKLSDGAGLLMRLYDPRVLPFWLDSLPPAYRHYVASKVVKWLFWAHDFGVQVMHLERTTADAPPPDLPMKLTLDVENSLMNACFPFTMIERMRTEDPAALNRLDVAQRYNFFRAQIGRAQAHGLSAQGELEAYCATAIEFGPTFDQDRQVHAALAGIKRGQRFDEAIASISNEDWERLRGAR